FDPPISIRVRDPADSSAGSREQCRRTRARPFGAGPRVQVAVEDGGSADLLGGGNRRLRRRRRGLASRLHRPPDLTLHRLDLVEGGVGDTERGVERILRFDVGCHVNPPPSMATEWKSRWSRWRREDEGEPGEG